MAKPRIAAPEDTDWTPLPGGVSVPPPTDSFGDQVQQIRVDAAPPWRFPGDTRAEPPAAPPADPYPLQQLPPPVTLPPRIPDEVPGIILTPPNLPPGDLEQGVPVPLDELPIPPGGFQLRRESKGPDEPEGYPILYDADGNRIGRVIPGHFTTGIVEGERGFDRAMLPSEADDWERIMRGTYGGPDDVDELLRGPVRTRVPPKFRVPVPPRMDHPTVPRGFSIPTGPAIILQEMREILRDYERRARQEREAIRPGPEGYAPPVPQPQPVPSARGERPQSPGLPPVPRPMAPPDVPREPPQPQTERARVPTPLPPLPPLPIPRLPAPIPRSRRPWWELVIEVLPRFFGDQQPWVTSTFVPQPLPFAPSLTTPPQPTPLPFTPTIASETPPVLPEPSPSAATSPALSPLTAFNTSPLGFSSSNDCDCSRRDNPPLPSDTIADMKPFKRRMSQYSLNNLRRGTRRP